MALLTISLILKESSVSSQMEKKLVPVSLDMYNNPETFIASYDSSIRDLYSNVSQSLGAKVMEATDSSLTSSEYIYSINKS